MQGWNGQIHCKKNNWPIRDVEATLEQEVKRGANGLETTVNIVLKIEGDITEEQKSELVKQADNCYIHRLLNGEWNILPIMTEPEKL